MALLLTGCATTEKTVNEENDAVQDFIGLNNLTSVSSIRNFDNPGHLNVNPRYVIAYVRKNQYLLQYAHDCRVAELETGTRPQDLRRRFGRLSVRTDTFLGCPVKSMYPITLAQAEELMIIGQGPGETSQ